MGPSGTGALQRSRKSAAGALTARSSSRSCAFACAYVSISVRISSLDLPLRPVKKAFTSGWLNRYDDVPALTPDMTPARSAAGQFGGSAAAGAAGGTSIAPAIMPAPITLRINMVAPCLSGLQDMVAMLSDVDRYHLHRRVRRDRRDRRDVSEAGSHRHPSRCRNTKGPRNKRGRPARPMGRPDRRRGPYPVRTRWLP